MNFSKEIISSIDQKDIFKIKLTNSNNFSITFFNYGGYIHNILIPNIANNINEDVVLGYKNFNGYLKDSSYFNCITGRVCGRIGKSQFYLNNKQYKLFSNLGSDHLHGGKFGFNKKIWSIVDIQQDVDKITCRLNYLSSHMEEGYPGNLNCNVNYTLNNKNEFIIKFEAESDEDTIVNLTNHNYWNFHGHKDNYQNLLDHKVRLFASNYLDTSKELIPTGIIKTILDKKIDFREFKDITKEILAEGGNNLCYEVDSYNGKIKKIAEIYSNKTKIGMQLSSDQPGLQFYTGNFMDKSYQGKNDRAYGYQYGICLEPEIFPDAINHPRFKSPILRSSDTYSSTIIMKLRNNF